MIYHLKRAKDGSFRFYRHLGHRAGTRVHETLTREQASQLRDRLEHAVRDFFKEEPDGRDH